MEKLTSIDLPVKMSLHSVIPKQNLLKTRQLATTVKPAALAEIPLKLSKDNWNILIEFPDTNTLFKTVSLYCHHISLGAMDAQGKVLNLLNDNCERLIVLPRREGTVKEVRSIFTDVSSDLAVEVKIILLEAKFKFVNEVVIPPCSCDWLTMQDLITQERLTDVKITITAKQKAAKPLCFFAHKAVLVARSPVFAKMFEHNLQESATSGITVSDIKPEVFKELLSYIYTNQVPNLSTMAAPLLYAAEKYHLDGLKARCEQFLSYNLQVSNAVQTLQLAQTYNASQLKQNTLLFIVEYIDEVRESKDWGTVKSNCDLMDELIRRMAEPVAKKRKTT